MNNARTASIVNLVKSFATTVIDAATNPNEIVHLNWNDWRYQYGWNR